MFAKQPSVLSKHQNELSPDRRPGSPGPANTAASGSGGHAPQPSLANTPLPIHPTAQNTAAAQSKLVAPPPQVEPEAQTGSRLIVGPDVKLKGAEILDCDTLVVEGRVEAVMDSRVIRIAEQGAFSGKVGIDIAEIFGEFDGELTARQQLIVHASGRVSGKIRYGKLLVEEGGTLSGDIQSLDASRNSSLNDNPPRSTASALSEKEVNTQMKSYLSTVAS
ncbi:MAG: cell shape determination protein CcmA [Rhodocyclales bacterium]|nr:cell shape determination protein CcmA [Rhodocyclales bacterium]